VADPNRVQRYLESQRAPRESARDVGLFIRDLTDPSTPDEDVERSYQEMRAAGKSDPEIGQAYLSAGKKHATTDWVRRRGELIKSNTDERARNDALAQAETGVQKVARIIAELGNAYTGGKPGEVTATLRKYRTDNRDRANESADRRLGLELEGLGQERDDQRFRDTLTAQAERDRRQASRESIAAQGERNFRVGQDDRKRTFDAEQNRLDRVSEEERARIRASRTTNVGPGQKALDVAAAKDYQEWVSGSRAGSMRSIAELKDASDRLLNTDNVSGEIRGNLPDWANTITGGGKAVDVREQVENMVQTSLRTTLGAQFTANEGERLIARAYNPTLPEHVNYRRLRSLATQLEEAAADRDAAAKHFEKYGTMEGYTFRFQTADDFKFDGDDGEAAYEQAGREKRARDGQAPPAPAAAPNAGRAGKIKMRNAQTGEELYVVPDDVRDAEAEGFRRAP